jgi:hypothetical protein
MVVTEKKKEKTKAIMQNFYTEIVKTVPTTSFPRS